MKGIKTLAPLIDGDGNRNGILDAARGLANAFSNLLDLLKPGERKVNTFHQIISDPFFCVRNYRNLDYLTKIRNSFF